VISVRNRFSNAWFGLNGLNTNYELKWAKKAKVTFLYNVLIAFHRAL